MNLERKYRKSLDQQWCLQINTRHPDGDKYLGVVTQVQPEFIILREVRDLEFDGIIVLPKSFVIDIRDGRFERCTNSILRHSGAMRRLRTPRWLDGCETIPGVLTALYRKEIWPGIEILFDEGAKSAFYLGPLVDVGGAVIRLRCYDAAGKWERTYSIDIPEICRIEFDSRYCNRFSAWMKRDESMADSST